MNEEIKYKHSKLKIIGSILFFGGSIGSAINAIITGDISIGLSILSFAPLGGVLMMVGFMNELTM